MNFKIKLIIKILMIYPAMGCLFFIPAGTWNYTEAWLYICWTGACMTSITAYLLNKDPALLERRMRMKEKHKEQRVILRFGYLVFGIIFLVPGFDKRFGWSDVSEVSMIAAFFVIFLGYLLFVRVLMENSYASRIIEVETNQKVITTGPYKYIRHPMYSAIMLIYCATPVALGSYWALAGSALVPLLLWMRIRNEEKVLTIELPGYDEYKQKTRYRLIPGIL